MYQKIRARRSVPELYEDKLVVGRRVPSHLRYSFETEVFCVVFY